MSKRTSHEAFGKVEEPAPKQPRAEELKEKGHSEQYIIHEGRRWVKPYHFAFQAYAKKRWFGDTLMELFTREFKAYPQEYYVCAP